MFVRLIQLVNILFLITPILCKDGYAKIDFDVRTGDNLVDVINNYFKGIGLKERGGAVSVNISNQRAFYIATLKIGSQNSEVSVLLDTGSSDLWVMSSKNSYCSSNGGSMDCSTYGTYDETSSSTFQDNKTDFSIKYLDQTYAKGTWGQDTIDITDDMTIQAGNLAVADDSDSNIGVFGIAAPATESVGTKYDNLPIQMKQQGFINKVAYSLYLTPAESEKGTVLFGGIDNAKYSGSLQEFDISLNNGQLQYLQIPLTNIIVNDNSVPVSSATLTTLSTVASPKPTIAVVDNVNNLLENTIDLLDNSKRSIQSIDINANALFDSGTTLTYLPQDAVSSILDQIATNATFNSELGGYQVPCSLRQPGSFITYNFGDKKTIDVPFTEFILDAGEDNTGQTQCILGLIASSQIILGDNFLRSCYTVFNLEDETLSIAQMNYSDVEDISIIN